MSKSEEKYFSDLREIKDRHAKEISALQRDYALSKNTIKVGDIVSSNCDTILVDRIWFASSLGSEIPQCIYQGLLFTKKMQPRKDRARRYIRASNITSVVSRDTERGVNNEQ